MPSTFSTGRKPKMLHYAVIFLVIALVAALFGFSLIFSLC